MDFDISTEKQNAQDLMKTKKAKGTPLFMPPELIFLNNKLRYQFVLN